MDGDQNRPLKLLFVDEDTRSMALAQHLLRRHESRTFTVLWRQDGDSALELLQRESDVDLILVDYYLPEKDGLQVIQQIRNRKIDIPLILLTARRDFRIAIDAMKFGVDDYILKDEGSLLPRSIINAIERVDLRRRLLLSQRAALLARKRADATKELVVTICHEFNNPLASVKISNDILKRQQLADPDAEIVGRLDVRISEVEREIARLRDINFGAPAASLSAIP
jgi:CheY-like chemotaxis protein